MKGFLGLVLFLALIGGALSFINIDCGKCDGNGSYVEKIKCNRCSGEGRMKCEQCNGLGESRCDWHTRVKKEGSFWAIDSSPCNVEFHCSGGEIQSTTKWNYRGEKCMQYTIGSTCFECNGRGFFKCYHCSSSGKEKCTSCKGNGNSGITKSCKKCKGKGESNLLSKIGF